MLCCDFLLSSFTTPFVFLVTFLQRWLFTVSVLVMNMMARCLVLWKPRAKLCAYGSWLCRPDTATLHPLRRWYVAWSRPRVRAGRWGESRGRRSANAQSVTIIKRGMRMTRCVEAMGLPGVTLGLQLSAVEGGCCRAAARAAQAFASAHSGRRNCSFTSDAPHEFGLRGNQHACSLCRALHAAAEACGLPPVRQRVLHAETRCPSVSSRRHSGPGTCCEIVKSSVRALKQTASECGRNCTIKRDLMRNKTQL
jgi:hypothetical protein